MRDLNECRPYVEHMRIEHQHIHDALRDVANLFATAIDDQASSDVASRLAKRLVELRDELSRHFAEEDEGGCMEEAVSRCPSLSREVDKVEGQHPFLLARLDDLIKTITADATAEDVQRQRAAFDVFIALLNQHEEAENRILQIGFGTGSVS